MVLTLVGLALGGAGSFGATRVMASMLYGVGTRDPITLAAVVVLLSLVAAVACLLPARKITKIDPIEALRYQ